jgi:short-subunit dehydrogenase
MSQASPRWALVTGASTGIGAEFARELARRGWHLVLTARSENRLQELAAELAGAHQVEVRVIPGDLALSGAPAELEAATEGAGVPVDLLVNNAGFGHLGPLAEHDDAHLRGMIAVNVGALSELTRRFGARMGARGRGYILNVASTAAFQPGPLMAVYYATKAYVLSFSEAARNEFAPLGVSVTTLCPGVTRSEFHARAGMAGGTVLERLPFASAQEVARFGIEQTLRGRGTVIPGLLNRVMALAVGFVPRRFVPGIVRRIQERRR